MTAVRYTRLATGRQAASRTELMAQNVLHGGHARLTNCQFVGRRRLAPTQGDAGAVWSLPR